MQKMRRTLSVKLVMVFFPSIMGFLVFGFFILRYKTTAETTAVIKSELHIAAAGAAAMCEGLSPDSLTERDISNEHYNSFTKKLAALQERTGVYNIALIKKTNGQPLVLASSRNAFKNGQKSFTFSNAPDELLQSIKTNTESFTKKSYIGEFGKVQSLFTPLHTGSQSNQYFVQVDSDCDGKKAKVMRTVWLTLIPVFLFCMVCLAVVVFLVTVFFVKPLNELRTNLDEIAAGDADLSMRLAVKSNDEISDTAVSFNRFIERLNYMVSDLKTNATEAHTVEKNLFSASQGTAASITEIHGNTEAISKSIETLHQNASGTNTLSENVSNIAKNLVEVIRQQTEASATSAEATENMIKSLAVIVEEIGGLESFSESLEAKSEAGILRMDETEKVVTDINTRIQAIDSFVKMINDIAEKTNMLAMNAAIESAHAGEFGKGFSVVSEEIRKLADESKKNADFIAKSLEDIIERMQSAASITQDTKISFTEIDKGVHQTGNAFTSMRGHATTVSNAADSIKQAVQNLRRQQDFVGSNAKKLGDVSMELRQTGGKIEHLAAEVSSGMGEIVLGMEEIARAQHTVVSEASKVNEITDAIQNQVNKFKTE
ncbi:MAG: methyl-accepting chemotaxis protein [Treponema sp.]